MIGLTIEELREIAQALDLRNRAIEADKAPNECECNLQGRSCGNVLTIVDRGTRCKDCVSGAHYH